MLPLAAACGGGEEPKTADDVSLDSDGPSTGPGIQMSSEIGGLDQDKVDATFAASVDELQSCLNAGSRRIEFIGGDVNFFVKIDTSGRLSHAHVEESTLGDRETEKCMLDVLRSRQWPKPVGGKTGLARKSFSFDPPADVRPPTMWSSDSIEETLEKMGAEISDCKHRSASSYAVTMYVDTDGSVLTAGVAHADEGGEDAADCLVATLKGAKFPSPGSWPAKVSFRL